MTILQRDRIARAMDSRFPFRRRAVLRHVLDDVTSEESSVYRMLRSDSLLADAYAQGEAVDLLERDEEVASAVGEMPSEEPSAPPRGWRHHWSVRFSPRKHRTTVSVEDDVVRIVVFTGRKVVAWGTAQLLEESASPLEDEATREDETSSVDVAVADRERLSSFIETIYPRLGRIVTDLPLYAPLVRRLHFPKLGNRKYLQDVIEAESLDLTSFTQRDADVKWLIRNRGKGLGHEVYTTVVSKDVLDAHVRMLGEIGLHPIAAHGQASALAFASGVADGLVVRLQPDKATVVLVRDDIPEVVHQVDLPPASSDLTLHERVEIVARVIEQVADLDSVEDGDFQAKGELIPVVVMGELSQDTEFADSLREAVDRPFLSPEPPLIYPEHFDKDEYVLNLGLALGYQKLNKKRYRSAWAETPWKSTSIDLLSQRHVRKPFPTRPLAVFISLLLFATAGINTMPTVDAAQAEAATLAQRLERLEQDVRVDRLERSQAEKLAGQVESASATVASLERHLVGLEEGMDTLRVRMDELTNGALPPGVSLEFFATNPEGFEFTGTASSFNRMLDYTDALRNSGLFADVRILQLEASSETGGVIFQAKAFLDKVQDSGNDDPSKSFLEALGLPSDIF